MDNLQYKLIRLGRKAKATTSFKPYYKWITFNTIYAFRYICYKIQRFKPYYKWITFNTEKNGMTLHDVAGSFKPYYKWITFNTLRKNRIIILEVARF